MKSPGQIAYEAYRNDAGGRSIATGAALPTWDDMGSRMRRAWENSAKAVISTDRGRENSGDPRKRETLDPKPGVKI